MALPIPLLALYRRHDLNGQGRVRQIVTHALRETRMVDWSADGLSLTQRFPQTTAYEWVNLAAGTLTFSYTPQSEHTPETWVHVLHFGESQQPERELQGPQNALREVAQRVFEGGQLRSASVYEQVSDQEMGWIESTVIPHPPQQGGSRREEVTSSYPDGLITVELREYDPQGREIYNESYSNNDDIFEISRTTYEDDAYGNWVMMRIVSHSNRPGSEQVYEHRREITYWEE